jgi:hypothetical protein
MDRGSWLVELRAPGRAWGIRVPWNVKERDEAGLETKGWQSLSEAERRSRAYQEARYEADHWLSELAVRGCVKPWSHVRREEWVMDRLARSGFAFSESELLDIRQCMNDAMLADLPVRLAAAASVCCVVWDSRNVGLSLAEISRVLRVSTRTLTKLEKQHRTGYVPIHPIQTRERKKRGW